jgi:hypothetical protein
MNIEHARPERAGAAGEVKRGENAQPALRPVQAAKAVERTDRVEISEAGRDLALRMGRPGRGAPLSPQRLAELRERVSNGYYDTPEVTDRVARRILESGELGRSGGEGEA